MVVPAQVSTPATSKKATARPTETTRTTVHSRAVQHTGPTEVSAPLAALAAIPNATPLDGPQDTTAFAVSASGSTQDQTTSAPSIVTLATATPTDAVTASAVPPVQTKALPPQARGASSWLSNTLASPNQAIEPDQSSSWVATAATAPPSQSTARSNETQPLSQSEPSNGSPSSSPGAPSTPTITDVMEEVAAQWAPMTTQPPGLTSTPTSTSAGESSSRTQPAKAAGKTVAAHTSLELPDKPTVTAPSEYVTTSPSNVLDKSLHQSMPDPGEHSEQPPRGAAAPYGDEQLKAPDDSVTPAAVTPSRTVARISTPQPDTAPAAAATPNTTASDLAVVPLQPLAAPATVTSVYGASPLRGSNPETPTSPAQQIAPVVIAMAASPANNQQVTVHLQPTDLGSVHITIERMDGTNAKIVIAAEKADTLDLLQRSQAQLHQSLDLAGIPALGRELTFHVATPQATLANTDSPATAGNPDPQGQPNLAQSNQQGSGNAHQTPYSQSQATSATGQREATVSARADTATATRTYRLGLDITA